jgi:hypothetical protein
MNSLAWGLERGQAFFECESDSLFSPGMSADWAAVYPALTSPCSYP